MMFDIIIIVCMVWLSAYSRVRVSIIYIVPFSHCTLQSITHAHLIIVLESSKHGI